MAAINRGDHATATKLAGQVLTIDHENIDAADLLDAPAGTGEIRRLSMLFADIVDSTVLSTRLEPEAYRVVIGRYREEVQRTVDHFEGYIGSTAGDGLLVVFGYPRAHENDAQRAVAASLEITRAVTALSQKTRRRFGVDIAVRVGVHRGVVYLDTVHVDVYGLGANLAARVSSLAPPNSVVVSAAIAPLVGYGFDLEERPPAPVKGVDGLINHFLVVGERAAPERVFARSAGGPRSRDGQAARRVGTGNGGRTQNAGHRASRRRRNRKVAAGRRSRRDGRGLGGADRRTHRLTVSHHRRPASGSCTAATPQRNQTSTPAPLNGSGFWKPTSPN